MEHPNKITTSKYTMINFLPLNLYHQLTKPATLFFFVTLIMVCIPSISPFSPWSYMAAVFIVVGISVIKDAVENYKRCKNDEEINEKKCNVLKDRRMVAVKVMDLQSGDLLVTKKYEEIPADVVLLRSKSRIKNIKCCTNYCFVDTSNLDGESNLKKKISILDVVCDNVYKEISKRNKKKDSKITSNIIDNKEMFNKKKFNNEMFNKEVNNTIFNKEYEKLFDQTNNNIEKINSVIMNMNNEEIKLCNKCINEIDICNFKIKESGDSFNEFDYVLYKNKGEIVTNIKNILLRGSIVRNTEYAVSIVVAVGENTKQAKSMHFKRSVNSIFKKKMDEILKIIGIIYFIMVLATTVTGIIIEYKSKNIKYINKNQIIYVIPKLLFSNYILYSYLVPLSLYVMIELCRFIHSLVIKYDRRMKIDGIKSICHCSEVIEDLGIIDYIITDKTGTITKNSMSLKGFHIPGNPALINTKEILAKPNLYSLNTSPHAPDQISMLLLNLLVNNSVEVVNKKYEGISQDELCFLKTLEKYSCLLVERGENHVKIKINGEMILVNLIHTVDFTSRRQNMMTLVQLGKQYYLLCKGSDHKLLCTPNEKPIRDQINQYPDYRLFVMKSMAISEHEIREIFNIHSGISLEDAREEINTTCDAAESRLDTLIERMEYQGSTFIKDELQDGIRETILLLKKAGIRIWMVTGDKRETALACARSSAIVEGPEIKCLHGKEIVHELEKSLEANNSDRVSDLFNEESLIIYRATPYQKGKIAQLMMKCGKNVLGIGDGNNDVGMLREANVGVGIMGKEGTQASLAGDFAIPEFRLLKYLLLLHGRYNLIRYSKIAINSYYKNLIFIGIQFFFNFFNGGSGKPIFNGFFMNYYNIIFTSLIPLSTALLDRDIPESKALTRPEKYAEARRYFSRRIIFLNLFAGLIQAAVIFFVVFLFVYFDFASPDGNVGGYAFTSTLFTIILFISGILRQVRSISFFTKYSYLSIFISVFFFTITMFWVHIFDPNTNSTIYEIFLMPIFYLIICAAFGIVYISDTVLKMLIENFVSK